MAPFSLAKDPPLFLKPSIPFEEYTMVRIEYTHDIAAAAGPPAVAAQAITHKRDVPFCPDSSDKERLLRVIDEYKENYADNILHLHDADRYENFCQVLSGSMKSTWTTITNTDRNDPAQCTDANFDIDLRTFIRRNCPSNSADLLKMYLAAPKTVKPHDYDCYELCACLELINQLSQYLPGSGGTNIFETDISISNAFFQLMLDPWQLKFTENGNSTDAPITYSNNNLFITMLISLPNDAPVVVVITTIIATPIIILNQTVVVLTTATMLLTVPITVPTTHLPVVVAILLALLVAVPQCIPLGFTLLELLLMVLTMVVVVLLTQLVVVDVFNNLVVAYTLIQLNTNWASFKIPSTPPYPHKLTP